MLFVFVVVVACYAVVTFVVPFLLYLLFAAFLLFLSDARSLWLPVIGRVFAFLRLLIFRFVVSSGCSAG